jgi:glycosyltransferase involved in cell wall biosynthesis
LIKATKGFSVIQACNPPDLIFLVAAPFKLLGVKFVFDQHDINPELFSVKFGRKGLLHKALTLCERLTYAVADQVITANQAFRAIAMGRGGQPESKIETVYSIPSSSRIHRIAPDRRARGNSDFVLGYCGIIGNQDGVDHMVRTVDSLVHDHHLENFKAVVVGDGPALESVKTLASQLSLDPFITFTGYLSGDALLGQLSDFDIGLIPDPVNESNDLMSMNKVFEYSALGIPTASYPLTETRTLLGDAAVYAETPDPTGLANACAKLMGDAALRAACALKATRLAAEKFRWENEAGKYVSAFERLAHA